MQSLNVTLESITPIFIGGADPRGEPELRAASFRGALRFWLRALIGSAIQDQDPGKIRKLESEVFGSTENASPVVLRVERPEYRAISFRKIVELDSRGNPRRPGIAYLFFTARRTKSDPERRAIPAGTRFRFTISLRPGTKNLEPLRRAYAALWLFTRFGGIGTRSRRGAGSLQAVAAGVLEDLPPLEVKAGTPQALKDEIAQGLRKLSELFSQHGEQKSTDQAPNFEILDPKHCEIWLSSGVFNSWEEALDAIGQAMRAFRNRRPPDYENIRGALQGRPLTQPIERAAFGLPIVFYFPSLDKQGVLTGAFHDRRASPILFRPIRLANGQYVIVIVWFKSKLLPEEERLKFERKKQKEEILVDQPTQEILKKFIEEIDSNNQIGRLIAVTGSNA
ncbi:type III-B CRISPR module RAMP protein Cmr1 [Thermoflexus sp.]|uniref:type III-B CRISPR module RAMP protein Cmr1 n=1 Tax=Thermoflexus sp. TaxID=1969742 RepID=UPI002ADDA8C6|nr:type III-B CRISPR module RAMP protein Cmr1 [Thermoflexus sp.]